jgi:acid-sensing ion channel, other
LCAYKTLTEDFILNFSIAVVTAVAQVCDPEVFGDLDPKNITNCEHCSEILNDMMPDVDDILFLCTHTHFDRICSEMFKKVITEEGSCYTYNSLDVFRGNHKSMDEWTLEAGYKDSSRYDVYPRTGSKYPLSLGLEVYNRMNDGLCKGPIQGFKVYFHLPNEVPHISKHYYLVPYKQIVNILISPNVIITAPDLRRFSAEKRQCYFNDERYLQFFKYYTQNNCNFECVANKTIKMCGCMRFDMPSKLSYRCKFKGT